MKVPAEQRFVLSNVDWDTYVTISDKLGERYIRLTYNGADLEFRTLSSKHELAKKRLGRLLNTLTEEMDIGMAAFGSMTCRREDLERGFEPDECYWIAHEAQLRGCNHIDLTEAIRRRILVLEVEISRSFLDRLAICARRGVPEVWRWNGRTLSVMVLEPEEQYVASERSRALPFLPVAELVPFLHPDATQSETKLFQTFRAWVREQMRHGWADATP